MQKTHFGWILSGMIDTSQPVTTTCNVVTTHFNLETFWNIESCKEEDLILKKRNVFHAFKREHSGRFIVDLPFKNRPIG